MALHLQYLRVFAAVAETGSFTQAAARLYISQPAVSKTVQEFERQLGLSLFERGGGPLRLSEAGTMLYQHARTIFAAERAAEEELAALRGLASGALHVGASTTIAIYLLPEALGRFHERYPNITLALTSANTHEIAEQLLEYRLDMAFVEGPVDDRRIVSQVWRSDELVVIAAPQYPLAQRGPLAAQDLAGQPFIIREAGSGTRDVSEAALRQHGIDMRVALELGSTEAIKQAVAAGLGLAVVSRATIHDQLALGTLATLDIAGLAMRRDLYELVRPGHTPSRAAQAFRALLE